MRRRHGRRVEKRGKGKKECGERRREQRMGREEYREETVGKKSKKRVNTGGGVTADGGERGRGGEAKR